MQNNIFSTLFVGQNLIKLPKVDSTNDFLKMLVSKSEPLAEGTVIMAEDQFSGRGQQGNIWHTEPGMNLTFSLLFNPVFLNINEQFFLNMTISVALRDALTDVAGPFIKIKWPNDIYFKDQKIGGILIENIISGYKYKTCIAGIGINVNQKRFDSTLKEKAIALCQILQQDVNLIELLAEICSHIEYGYLKLKSGRYINLQSNYLNGLYRFCETASFRQNGEIIEGKIIDVTAQGRLVVLVKGIKHFYNFKEIEFLNNTP